MPIRRVPGARAAAAALSLAVLVAPNAGCGTAPSVPPALTDPPASADPSPGEPRSTRPAASPIAARPPTPSPTPAPTPRYTNQPDLALEAVIPDRVGSVALVRPAVDEYALTPGDVGEVYGELGLRFASLAIAYAQEPQATLYAVRLEGGGAETEELRPYLAEAARYVGVSELAPEAWSLVGVDAGHLAWRRPGDRATVPGTTLYTWAADEFVFLLIGADDAFNRALVGALPGEPAARPSPRPTAASPETAPEPSPSGSA